MLSLAAGLVLAAEPVLVTAERVVGSTWPGEHDDDALRRAALEGMLEHLNARESVPVNRLLEGDERARPGTWGLGLSYLLVPDRGLVVTDVVPGSSAADAGLVPGDLLTRLAGVETRGGPDDVRLPTLRGEPVELLVERAGGHVARFALAPGPLPPHTLRWHHDHLCLIVRAPDEGLAPELAAQLADRPDPPLVVDLRGARGGTVLGAVGLVDLLLPAGALIGWEIRAGSRQELRSARPGRGASVAVLIDGSTRGPAELVAASLQHHARATLIGTPTAGWAGSTGVRYLDERFALELVDARLRDPAGASWDGGGVTPDLLIHPALDLPADGGHPTDAQRLAALRALGLAPSR